MSAMRTLGVDLSVAPEKTATATILWEDGGALVEQVTAGVDDDALLAAIAAAEFAGIDSPLGWPRAMAAAVAAHSRGEPWPAPTKDEFRHRRTDRVVIERLGLHPLSVAADRIALPAWRIAGIRGRLAKPGGPGFDLAGADGVYEVYPAAGLVAWGLPRSGYKGAGEAGREKRAALLAELERRAPWLRFADPDAREDCVATDHPLDAVLAALLTRAAATGRSLAPAGADREAARAEGWIHLPEVALEDLPA